MGSAQAVHQSTAELAYYQNRRGGGGGGGRCQPQYGGGGGGGGGGAGQHPPAVMSGVVMMVMAATTVVHRSGATAPSARPAMMRGRKAGSGQCEGGSENRESLSELVRFITFHFLLF